MKPFARCLTAISLILISAPLSGQQKPIRIEDPFPPNELVFGRTAKIKTGAGGMEGELLSVSRDSLWVLSSERVLGMALGDLREVDVRLNKWGATRAWTWNLVAGLGSAVALTAACAARLTALMDVEECS